MARLKLIQRWPLMRTVTPENVQEHSHQVATVAHMLALIKNKKYGGNLNVEKVALIALYHDASEVFTGDLPSPIKYFNNEIANEYKKIEAMAETQLVSLMPAEFQDDFAELIEHHKIDPDYAKVVKAADVICGYLKTIEEIEAGNHEFEKAKNNIYGTMQSYMSEEVKYFLEVFVPSFKLNLDEISSDL